MLQKLIKLKKLYDDLKHLNEIKLADNMTERPAYSLFFKTEIHKNFSRSHKN